MQLSENTIASINSYAKAACAKFRLPYDCYDDVYQDGWVEALKCIERFDPTRSSDIDAYTRWCVSKACNRSARNMRKNRERETSNYEIEEPCK